MVQWILNLYSPYRRAVARERFVRDEGVRGGLRAELHRRLANREGIRRSVGGCKRKRKKTRASDKPRVNNQGGEC
jgi:hypothetical protein